MAWRLRLAPEKTNIDFFRLQWITLGASAVAVLLSFVFFATLGFNFGIDFKGGTTIRTESSVPVDVGVVVVAVGTPGPLPVHVTGEAITGPCAGLVAVGAEPIGLPPTPVGVVAVPVTPVWPRAVPFDRAAGAG